MKSASNPVQYRTNVQWHEGEAGREVWHEVGEVADLSRVADLADLIALGTVSPVAAPVETRTGDYRPSKEAESEAE